MADGIFYRDTRAPFQLANLSAITLLTTMQQLTALGVAAPGILPANYWWAGKCVKLTAIAKVVTGATPGNFQWGMSYGSTAAPACNVSTVARAAVASVTTTAFLVGYAKCWSTGTSGTLSMWGYVMWDLAGQLSTNQPNVFPSGGGPTVVSTIDTTAAGNQLSFQANRSGSTAETVQLLDMLMEALN
jgi:hypothetical protein